LFLFFQAGCGDRHVGGIEVSWQSNSSLEKEKKKKKKKKRVPKPMTFDASMRRVLPTLCPQRIRPVEISDARGYVQAL
jgi:hypothetical protein